MTITLDRPVGSGAMTEEPILDRAAVGRLIGDGVEAATIAYYQKQSKPGGRYEHNPFPKEDGRFGGAPYWLASSQRKIREWDARRPRPGVGGGRRAQEQS